MTENKFNLGNIEGVKVIDRNTFIDDRGRLTEVYRTDEDYHKEFVEKITDQNDWESHPKINQVYLVENPVKNTIRAFHKHQKLWDFFSIIKGRAVFVLVDDRKDSPSYQQKMRITLDSSQKKMLVVPPGIYHGWKSIQDDTILLSIASHTYNKENPDEERVPYKSFGENWEVEFK